MTKKLIGKCIVATLAGVLFAGCGGGSGGGSGSGSPSNFTPTATMCCGGGGGGGGTAGTSPAGTPVASYIADAQGTSFVGYWLNLTTSAQVITTNLAAGLSAGTYNIALGGQVLSGTTWNTATLSTSASNLTPTGWVKESLTGNTFVDNGDGIHATENRSNGATLQYAIGEKNLTGTAIVCYNSAGLTAACSVSGSYPGGAIQYTLTYATTLYTISGLTPVTDGAGVALTASPTIGSTTFCDPRLNMVFKPIVGAIGTAPNYSVYTSVGCSATAITTALAKTAAGTVLASSAPTGNSVVPSVLTLSGWTGALTGLNSPTQKVIYGVSSAQVYSGFVFASGFVDGAENKIAINAELAATGFPKIP